MGWAGAAIGALGSLGGAAIGARSEGQARKEQSRANREALQYQREKDAMSRQQWQQAMAAYEANRNALLRRYGMDIGGPAPGPDMNPRPGAVPRRPTLGDLVMRKGGPYGAV